MTGTSTPRTGIKRVRNRCEPDIHNRPNILQEYLLNMQLVSREYRVIPLPIVRVERNLLFAY
ncbi:MAG: hypothetical protein K0R57_2908 [Paenibacillaceae bacterium]|jgi:hypothetical protein|nr:hypothetical protein [Paenibacillaceae bacterium]